MRAKTKLAVEKDLEGLRKAVQDLDQQLHRLTFLRLSVTLVCTTLFGVGLYEGGAGEVSQIVRGIRETADNTGFARVPIDPFTLLFRVPDWTKLPKPRSVTAPASDASAAHQLPDLSQFEEPAEAANLQAQTSKLAQRYRAIFQVSFSVLGTPLKFDLRVIVLILPLILPLWHAYLSICKQKRQLLSLVASERVRCNPDSATSLDWVMFGNSDVSDNPFAEFPYRLTGWMFTGTLAALAAGFIWLGHDFIAAESSTLGSLIWLFLEWCLTAALCSSVLIEYLRRRLSRQFEALFGFYLPAPSLSAVSGTIRRGYFVECSTPERRSVFDTAT